MFKFDSSRFFALFFIMNIVISNSNSLDLRQRMINHRIVPDMIPEPPLHKLKIFYPIDDVIQEVRTGQTIFHVQGEREPKLEWPTREKQSYTLFMGVRAPIYDYNRELRFNPSLGNQTHVQWENWIVVNIPGNSVANGSELLPYRPLHIPLPRTQDLTMIFIWEQPEFYESIKYDQHMGAKSQYGNTQLIRTFTDQLKLGTPWAGDFFYVKVTT